MRERAREKGRVYTRAVTDAPSRTYLPLLATARLYAGWLLLWYGVIFVLGHYASSDRLPFALPFIDSLYQSPFILHMSFGTYLFLLLSSMYRAFGDGAGKAMIFTLLWLTVFWTFFVNT